jgi:hypothetical protein
VNLNYVQIELDHRWNDEVANLIKVGKHANYAIDTGRLHAGLLAERAVVSWLENFGPVHWGVRDGKILPGSSDGPRPNWTRVQGADLTFHGVQYDVKLISSQATSAMVKVGAEHFRHLIVQRRGPSWMQVIGVLPPLASETFGPPRPLSRFDGTPLEYRNGNGNVRRVSGWDVPLSRLISPTSITHPEVSHV